VDLAKARARVLDISMDVRPGMIRWPATAEPAVVWEPENLAARSLYAALGFVEGDEWADDEVVARRPV
jgi:hypothetical protein